MACMGGRVGVKNFRGVFACGERGGGGVGNLCWGGGRLYYWGRANFVGEEGVMGVTFLWTICPTDNTF